MKICITSCILIATICITIGVLTTDGIGNNAKYIPTITPKPEINKGNLPLSGEIINSKVNIATANLAELDSLYGIGETYAKRIIEYRTEKPFRTIEDIMHVSGIGESRFEKIKDSLILE